MPPADLRPYQAEAIARIEAEVAAGLRRILLVAPTAAGKTVRPGRRRAENRAHALRGTYQAPALVVCPECQAVRFQGKPCLACGWQPRSRAAAVDVLDGQLGKVDRQRQVAAMAIDRGRFHGMLAWIARDRGHASGWIAHKFREKFGTWPPSRFVTPIAPDDATRAWVRSRAIAYARAMDKERGAV